MAEEDLDGDETTPTQTLLLEALGRELAPYGFVLEPGRSRFRRAHDRGSDKFSVTYHQYATGGCRVILWVSVRFDRVEDIFHQTSGFEKKYQNGTSTVGTTVGELLGGKPREYEYDLKSDDQIPAVVTKLIRDFKKVGLPFYEKFNSLAAVDAALNNKPGEQTVYRGGPPWFRCSAGIIVAKLVGRKNYDQLAKIYLDVVAKTTKGFYMKRFEPLLKSLESIQSQTPR